MKDGLGQIEMSEMSRAFGHVSGARLAPGSPVDDTLARIHQAAQLWPPAFISFGEPDATLGDGHPSYLVRPKDAELNPSDAFDRGFGIRRVDRHRDFSTPTADEKRSFQGTVGRLPRPRGQKQRLNAFTRFFAVKLRHGG